MRGDALYATCQLGGIQCEAGLIAKVRLHRGHPVSCQGVEMRISLPNFDGVAAAANAGQQVSVTIDGGL